MYTIKMSAFSSILGLMTCFSLFFPYLVAMYIPVRVAVLFLCICVICFEGYVVTLKRSYVLILPSLLLGYIVLGIAGSSFIADQFGSPLIAMNLQRLLLVTPLAVWAGYAIWMSPARAKYLYALIVIASIVSVLALAERLSGSSVFGRPDIYRYTRSDSVRALAGSEQPLVLGSLLAATIPLASLLPRILSYAFAGLIVAGTYATGSRSAMIIAVAIGIVATNGRFIFRLRESYVTVRCVALASLLFLVLIAPIIFDPVAGGFQGESFSANYRGAAYSYLHEILYEYPFGAGLGDLPKGEYLIATDIFGVRDMADTIDAELVYSALTLGFFGLILVCTAWLVAVCALRYSFVAGGLSTVICISGLFLALHAWESIGPLWYLSIGMSWAALRQGMTVASLDVARRFEEPVEGEGRVSYRLGYPSPLSDSWHR